LIIAPVCVPHWESIRPGVLTVPGFNLTGNLGAFLEEQNSSSVLPLIFETQRMSNIEEM